MKVSMVSKEVLQRAVLEAVQAKIRRLGGLEKEASDRFYFYRDFAASHPTIAKELTPEGIAHALLAVEEEMGGRFVLKSVQYESTQPWLNQGLTSVDHDPSDQDHYWEFEYKTKPTRDSTTRDKSFYLFYLTKEPVLYRQLSGNKEVLPIAKGTVPHRVLMAFAADTRHDYVPTDTLAQEAETTVGNLRGEIRALRLDIEKAFDGILGTEFIEAKQREGYKLGDKITLKER